MVTLCMNKNKERDFKSQIIYFLIPAPTQSPTFIASVRRPCTLIAVWTFVSCVRGLLSPASLNMRARANLRGLVILLRISAYKIIRALIDRLPSQEE